MIQHADIYIDAEIANDERDPLRVAAAPDLGGDCRHDLVEVADHCVDQRRARSTRRRRRRTIDVLLGHPATQPDLNAPTRPVDLS